MSLLSSVNHVAILTEDLDQFVDFYRDVFELEVVFRETAPDFRHAILRTGPDSWIHPVEVTGNPHAKAIPAMFQRGHLDHLALTAASYDDFDAIRERLVSRGLCDGSIQDLGAFHAFWFDDPDGMSVEVVVITNTTLEGIHEPRPMTVAAG